MLDKIELYEIDDKKRAFIGLYETPWDDLFPRSTSPGPVTEEAIPMFDGGDIMCFMKHEIIENVTDRFEHISGIAWKGNFHYRVRTLADKMSAREGRFLIIPNKIIKPEWGGVHKAIKGQAIIECPRKVIIKPQSLIAEWITTDAGYAVGFRSLYVGEIAEMSGSAASAADVPWNWHYGFEIFGSIPLIP
jgi:hypothetical protein